MSSPNAQPVAPKSVAPITSCSGAIVRSGTENEAGGSNLVTPRRSGRQIPNHGKTPSRELRMSARTRRLMYGETSTTDTEQVTPDRVRQVNRSMARNNASRPRNRQIASTEEAREKSRPTTRPSGTRPLDSQDGSDTNPFQFYRCYETPIDHILPLPEEEPEVIEIFIEDSPGKVSSPLPRS
ncbi:uncharacterized protein MELLADRAFT_109400 [Melampsora larici-populina 98AG31]|uniref:Uncharacterized protein n=1 Tax=Melampsora larici-populina (strain 98AG31 / pathotype 3-4-7) TaxID=747676 RepID=F4RWC6_MELLP|nr:uncharacterized protein MELLADRAFT_109400 [Melampsora larici-populina 98AG31]EGG03262.1 hypothetical protein MELLADRAFT_109400 [Melampsora larici-populina 98AG31]